jgi:hypothetical protein
MIGGMSNTERLSTALWQRNDRLFLELGILDRVGKEHHLRGTALYRGRSGPTSVTYTVRADEQWRTRTVDLILNEPTGSQTLSLVADGEGQWWRDGSALALPWPCFDIDIAITPSTNTLAIRRLNLDIGQSAVAQVLWVQVPSLAARAVEQTYERVEKNSYRFKGRFGSYKIDVDDNGVVLDYPGGGWQAAAHRVTKAATPAKRTNRIVGQARG